ncbi:uncharacterized protein PV09_08890 [Verruconis gallopava]|uniref:ER-bound oxygenase mpaB/mpaB'/Rubber oxygenase catalytic domain-containing protein n=1 Tax=Verruconis gallopava TaxID=253628 RepID=A0A0D1ZZK4_9PEZI|nr:uncharacterized protein PV09_08890 [Verruconis gallopava]KIV99469.1 hypothetical protein PV09_08890 [Verruconis gallopava]
MAAAVDYGHAERWSQSEKSEDVIEAEKTRLKHSEDPQYEPVAEIHEIKKIIREGITLTSGLTAVLLQVAHPVVGRGVGIHSEFSKPGRAVDRAEKTGIFIYVFVFGTEEQKKAMQHYINMMHSRVKGGEGKTAYYAKDPHAQLWVAATLYATMIGMYEMAFGPLPHNRAERVYKEFSYLGTALQMPPELWPVNRAAFWRYYADMIENHLEVTPEAEKVLYDLLHPFKPAPWYAKPFVPFLMPIVKAITIEQLPVKVRQDYGLRSTKFTRFVNSFTVATATSVYPALPLFIRQAPKTFFMWRIRKMMKKRGVREYKK